MDETEAKQAEVKKLDEFAKKKAQEDLARTMAFNHNVLGGVGLAPPMYGGAQYLPPQPSSEVIVAEAIRNLAMILEQFARIEHDAVAELRQHIKDTIRKLL